MEKEEKFIEAILLIASALQGINEKLALLTRAPRGVPLNGCVHEYDEGNTSVSFCKKCGKVREEYTS